MANTIRGEVLEAALNITEGARNSAYGDPVDNHDNIASLVNAYLEIRRAGGNLLSPLVLDAEDMAMIMALVKVARIAQRLPAGAPRKDSYIDGAAYLAIAYECAINQ